MKNRNMITPGPYWLIVIAALYAIVFPERNTFVTIILLVMVASGTLSCVFRERGQGRRDRA